MDILKSKVIVYGNCHTTAIINVLNNNPSFCERYVIHPIPPIQNITDTGFFSKENFGDCDVFIHQSIQLNNRYGKEFASNNILKLLKPECKVIAIPNVYHLPMCFFPQYEEATPLREVRGRKATHFFRDAIIDEGYTQNNSVAEIAEKYQREDLYDADEIKEEFRKFIEKVRMREKDWNIKISDFINENFQKRQLFYDPNHPTNFLLEYIAYKLLSELLGNEELKFEDVEGSCKTRMDSFEMPICECVKRALDLQYGGQNASELRVTGIKERIEKMYLKEYINQYISREWTNSDLSLWLRIKSFLKWFRLYIINNYEYQKKLHDK